MPLTPVFQVHEFNEVINIHLERLGRVTVAGEISSLNVNQNKWIFISLTDAHSTVEVFSMVYQITNLNSLAVGMSVHIDGLPKLHQRSGRFRLYAHSIVPTGAGALQLAFQKLKGQLETEGLFDPSRKRPLPRLPQRIGLITASGSQAFLDVQKVTSKLGRGVTTYFIPAQVQGEAAPASLKRALHLLAQHQPPLDLIIITRGGGSAEDLSSFNDEALVRQVFASPVPVVAAIGHEGDICLTELAADLRAATPTAAAAAVFESYAQLDQDLELLVSHTAARLTYRLTSLELDTARLIARASLSLQEHISQLSRLIDRYYQHLPRLQSVLAADSQALESLQLRLENRLKSLLHHHTSLLSDLTSRLSLFDLPRLLSRGYSLTLFQGRPLTSVSGLKAGQAIETHLARGTITSSITHLDNAQN